MMAAIANRFKRQPPPPEPVISMVDYAREQARIADEIDARQADVARRIRMLQTQIRVVGARPPGKEEDDARTD